MHAALSGQARTAFLVEDGWFGSMHAEEPGIVCPRSAMDFHRLFQFAEDVVFLEGVTETEVRERLDGASRGASVVALVMLLLSREEPTDVRRQASEDISEVFTAESACWSERLLLAQSAPKHADFVGAIAFCGDPGCAAFLRRLEALQPFVRKANAAWAMISDELFDGPDDRKQFDAVMVREGVVSGFVRAAIGETAFDAEVSRAVSLPAARAFGNRARALQAWRDGLFSGPSQAPGTWAEPVVLLRAVQSMSERLAGSLAEILSVTARHARAASQHAPVPTVEKAVEWQRLQVPLEYYFLTVLGLSEVQTAPWRESTLSVQRRVNQVRFVLNAPPSEGHALAVAIGEGIPVKLDSERQLALVQLPDSVSVADVRFAIVPFRRDSAAVTALPGVRH